MSNFEGVMKVLNLEPSPVSVLYKMTRPYVLAGFLDGKKNNMQIKGTFSIGEWFWTF